MKKFIEARLDWIERQFPPTLKISIKREGRGRIALLSTSAGEIYFTIDGTDPRASGGGTSLAARAYQSPLPLKTDTKLFARVREASRWGAPLVWSE